MYDAIIVSAWCAGSSNAMLLARKGYSVVVLDKATFPSDTISTHIVKYPGVKQLEKWDLLDSVLATGCPPITGVRPTTASVPSPGRPYQKTEPP